MSTHGLAERTELALLQQATALLRSPAGLAEVLTELMEIVAAAARARGVAIALLEQAGKLAPCLALNLPPEYLVASSGAQVGLGVCGQAIRNAAPVIVADVRTDPRFACASEPAQQLGIVSVLAMPITTGDGISLGALAVHLDRAHTSEDIEGCRAYADLAAAILEHQRADGTGLLRDADVRRRRQEYLASVAHDLRNPLSAIVTSAALLQRGIVGAATDRSRQQVEIVLRSARHMDRLITDLLDLAQIESGRFRLCLRRHGVKELVRDAIEAIQAQAQDISLEMELGPGVTTVCCDLERLLQVLGNLLGNAIKFTPAGGSVRVAAALKDEAVEFTVADSGIGIPGDQLERIFDRYWQAKQQSGRGVGLGLSIARGIVEAHGGHIRAESVPGIGTTFSFTVPLRWLGSRSETAEDLAEFFDLSVAAVRTLLAALEQEEAWGPGPTPEVGLISVAPGPLHPGAQAFLVRIASGASHPHHVHHGDEHILVIEGGIRDDDGSELWAGERVINCEGTCHASTAIGEGPCVLAAMVMPSHSSGQGGAGGARGGRGRGPR